MKKRMRVNGSKLEINLELDNQQELCEGINFVKGLDENCEYFYNSHIWALSNNPINTQKLLDYGFIFENPGAVVVKVENSKPDADFYKQFPGLYPFQVEGVHFLENRKGVGIVGDQMGLGKTVQALGYIKIHPEFKRILIVCSSSIKINWACEIAKWIGNVPIKILSGKKPNNIDTYGFFIINYDIFDDWVKPISMAKFDVVVADEAHYLANEDAKRTKAFMGLVSTIDKKIFLSGTPIKDKPSQFFNMLFMVDPIAFPNRLNYWKRYCDYKSEMIYIRGGMPRKVWTHNGAINLPELKELIAPYIIRRLKENVLIELPEKRKIIVSLAVDLDEYKKYIETKESLVFSADNTFQENRNNLNRLKRSAYGVKRNSAIQWIRDYLESGEKLVIFAWHTSVIADLLEEFKKIAVMVDGSVTAEKRQKAVDSFQNNPEIKVFIGQMVAAGVGLTLTAASAVAFVEFSWAPADHEQAEDRIHRIGQKSDSVTAYYLVADGTIDNKIAESLIKKNKVVKSLLDGVEEAKFFGEGHVFGDILSFIKGGE